MNFFRLSLLIAIISLAGCSNSMLPASSPSPYVDFECNSAQSNHCGSMGDTSPVYMGLTHNLSFNCESELSGLPQSLFIPTFDYSGMTTAQFNGAYLLGVVTQWVNSAGSSVQSMPNEDYKLCAFIDYNRNGQLDFGETLGTATINPGQDFYPVSQWYQF